jgi:cell division protein YceG involved in septum cleavage
MKSEATRIALIIVAVLVLVTAGATHWVYRDLHRRISHPKSGQFIEVSRGSSPAVVIKKLSNEGIIKHEWPVLLYLKLSGAGSRLRAGEYNFSSPISPLEVIAKLEQGEQRFLRLTVVEGWTRWEIAAAMATASTRRVRSRMAQIRMSIAPAMPSVSSERSLTDLQSDGESMSNIGRFDNRAATGLPTEKS